MVAGRAWEGMVGDAFSERGRSRVSSSSDEGNGVDGEQAERSNGRRLSSAADSLHAKPEVPTPGTRGQRVFYQPTLKPSALFFFL